MTRIRTSLALAICLPVMVAAGAPASTFTVRYNFKGAPTDGGLPYYGSLIRDPGGNLYGTTWVGGASNGGAIFKLDATGAETLLYSFTGGTDGGTPYAGLIQDGSGNLYGTTLIGGAFDQGVVFKLDTGGTETVLYS